MCIRFFGDHDFCSVKAFKVGFWLVIKCGSWCHVLMLFSSPDFWLINEIKNVSLETNLSRDISFKPSQSNPYILPQEFERKVSCEISFQYLVCK